MNTANENLSLSINREGVLENFPTAKFFRVNTNPNYTLKIESTVNFNVVDSEMDLANVKKDLMDVTEENNFKFAKVPYGGSYILANGNIRNETNVQRGFSKMIRLTGTIHLTNVAVVANGMVYDNSGKASYPYLFFYDKDKNFIGTYNYNQSTEGLSVELNEDDVLSDFPDAYYVAVNIHSSYPFSVEENVPLCEEFKDLSQNVVDLSQIPSENKGKFLKPSGSLATGAATSRTVSDYYFLQDKNIIWYLQCVTDADVEVNVSNAPIHFYDKSFKHLGYLVVDRNNFVTNVKSNGETERNVRIFTSFTYEEVISSFPTAVYFRFNFDTGTIPSVINGRLANVISYITSNEATVLKNNLIAAVWGNNYINTQGVIVQGSRGYKIRSYTKYIQIAEGVKISGFVVVNNNIIALQDSGYYTYADIFLYDDNFQFVGYIANEHTTYDLTDTEYIFTAENIASLPTSAKYFRVNITESVECVLEAPNSVSVIDTQEILENHIIPVMENPDVPSNVDVLRGQNFTGQWINNKGEISTNANSKLSDYIQVAVGDEYFYSGGMSGTNPLVVAFDSNKQWLRTVISAINGQFEQARKFEITDSNVAYIRVQSVQGTPTLKTATSLVSFIAGLGSSISMESLIPQIRPNAIRKRETSDGLRLLCFGSSWFQNTWWYLKDLLREAGINAEMTCFYTGGAYFQQWIDRYENNTAVDCWVSVNGANYTTTQKNFRDTLEEGWDIIAYQQGAYQSRQWSYYEDSWSKLLSYIRRSCGYDTVIAFNSTWTPAKQGNLSPYPNTDEGQKQWQEEAYTMCKRFLALSGLNDFVAPNGATLWAVRHHEDLKDETTDLAGDGLHPNNGLPMYSLSATWFETFIAPMFGVSIDEIDWIPNTETQKAPVSGTRWTDISTAQRDIIRKIVRLSASNRFGFETL